MEPGQSPVNTSELYENFPLILISGERVKEYIHTQPCMVPVLRNVTPEPLAEINPATATQYGLVGGTMVKIETKNGSMQIRLKTNGKLATGVVSVPHGTAYPDFNQLLCKVVPA